MGKKSKKKGKGNKSGATSSSSALSPNTTDVSIISLDNLYPPYPVPPKDADCWICLEDNHSAEDPLVRDCSCRGSAGWGHLSCITQYAQQKSKEFGEGNTVRVFEWMRPFSSCPNCHQLYNKRLTIDLANELVSFTRRNMPCQPFLEELGFQYNPHYHVQVLLVKLRCYTRPQLPPQQLHQNIMDKKMSDFVSEGIKLGSEMLSIIDQMKRYSIEIFGTPSVPASITQLEANTHNEFGNLYAITSAGDVGDRIKRF